MATLSSLMIALGINLTGLNQGLNQAKGNLKNFSGEVGNMGRSFANAATANYLLVQGLYQLQAAVRTSFAAGLKAADDYRLGVLNVASTLTDMTEEGSNKQEAFNNLLIYSQEMYKLLEIEAARHFASGKELQLAWTILAQHGVAVRYEEVTALGIIVDKIKLITQGQASTVQITQELRSMMVGQARSTDMLARLLLAKYGEAWKQIVAEQRKSGTLIQWLSIQFQGLAIAMYLVTETIESQATTLWTMIRRVGREGLGGAYDYIVYVMKIINRYLIEQEQTISIGILGAWGAIEPIISIVGIAIRDMLAYVWSSGPAFVTMIGYVTVFVKVIDAAARALLGFSEGYSWIVQLIAAFLALKLVIAIVASMLGMVLSLVAGLWGAVTAINAFFAISLGLGVITGGFLTLATAIAAVGVAIASATWLMEVFGISAKKVLEDVKASVAFAQGATMEDIRRRQEKYPGYAERLRGEGIDLQTVMAKTYTKEVREKGRVQTFGTEGHHEEWVTVQKTITGPFTMANDAAFINEQIAKGEIVSVIDPKSKKIRFLGGGTSFLTTDTENAAALKAGLDAQKLVPGVSKDKDTGKAPEKLLAKEWEIRKAIRATELQEIKNHIKELEALHDMEKDLLAARLEAGIINGKEYLLAVMESNKKLLEEKRKEIAKERQVEEDARLFRQGEIDRELAEGRISGDKAAQEKRLANVQSMQRQTVITGEAKGYELKYEKDILEVVEKQLAARKAIFDMAIDLMSKLAWGPIQERAVALLNIAKEYDKLSADLRKLQVAPGFEKTLEPGSKGAADYIEKLKKAMEADPNFVKTVERMQEAAIAFGNPEWAMILAEVAAAMKEATDPVRIQKAIEAMQTKVLPGMKAEADFQIKWRKTIDGITNAISSGMADIAMEIMTGGKKVKDVMVSMVKNIFQAILKPQFEILGDLIMRLLSAMFKKIYASIVTDKIMGDLASSVLGFFGGLFGGSSAYQGVDYTTPASWFSLSAHGNVFQRLARGGIVNKPTLFPMASGMGLMGEAGTEAIMPLTRIGGDLGVKAMFGEKSEPKITVINNLGVEATPKTSGSQEDLVIQLDKANAQNLSRGGRQTKVLEKMYGLRPVTTRR